MTEDDEPLVLLCEYGGQTVWRYVDGGPRVTAVDVESLSLSQSTREALMAWNEMFVELTSPPDRDPPPEPTDAAWDVFISEGGRLRDVIAAELRASVVLDHGRRLPNQP